MSRPLLLVYRVRTGWAIGAQPIGIVGLAEGASGAAGAIGAETVAPALPVGVASASGATKR